MYHSYNKNIIVLQLESHVAEEPIFAAGDDVEGVGQHENHSFYVFEDLRDRRNVIVQIDAHPPPSRDTFWGLGAEMHHLESRWMNNSVRPCRRRFTLSSFTLLHAEIQVHKNKKQIIHPHNIPMSSILNIITADVAAIWNEILMSVPWESCLTKDVVSNQRKRKKIN
ncbi:hypothetical protein FRC03_005382 [Tulasnella sp. 419]|nr:hypothetical protein FRC03_005382 [Tulasnella sp. 419]